jgi:hypothetical protein
MIDKYMGGGGGGGGGGGEDKGDLFVFRSNIVMNTVELKRGSNYSSTVKLHEALLCFATTCRIAISITAYSHVGSANRGQLQSSYIISLLPCTI